jgi:hypothetical protein
VVSINIEDLKGSTHGFFTRGTLIKDVHAISREIRNGRKIPAIKELRAQTGWDLRTAKNYIDEYMPNFRNSEETNNMLANRFIEEHTHTNLIEDDEFKV